MTRCHGKFGLAVSLKRLKRKEPTHHNLRSQSSAVCRVTYVSETQQFRITLNYIRFPEKLYAPPIPQFKKYKNYFLNINYWYKIHKNFTLTLERVCNKQNVRRRSRSFRPGCLRTQQISYKWLLLKINDTRQRLFT